MRLPHGLWPVDGALWHLAPRCELDSARACAVEAGRRRAVSAAEAPATDRIWTWPNALSFLRLLGVPVFLWLLLGPHADGWALGILFVSGFTDWADGALARKL